MKKYCFYIQLLIIIIHFYDYQAPVQFILLMPVLETITVLFNNSVKSLNTFITYLTIGIKS